MFASFQGFVSPESFSLQESVMIVAMVVLGGIGHIPGVILGAVTFVACHGPLSRAEYAARAESHEVAKLQVAESVAFKP